MSDMRLPWTVRPLRHDDWGWIRDADGETAAQAKNSKIGSDKFDEYRRDGMDPYEDRANFIIKAVNNHDALVQALKEIAELGDVRADEAGMVARRALDRVGTGRDPQ
jgi:hypothetical protein